jgi:DNA excision repair protein ERCC-2
VVVDEAHNLPDRIRAELAVDLTPDDVSGASHEARRFDRRLSKRLEVLAEALRSALGGVGEEGRVDLGFLEGPLRKALGSPAGEPKAEEAFLERVEGLGPQLMPIQGRSALLDLSVFLHRWGQAGPGVLRTAVPGESARLTCRLLDPSLIAGPVFAAIHGSIVMSGTLHPAEMFADLLGVDPLRRTVAAYSSPFPPANRLILAVSGLTTQYDARSPEMTSTYAKTINSLAAQVPGNAAVFFPSYELLAAVKAILVDLPPAKRLVWEERGMEKAKREGLLEALRAARAEGGLLLLGVLAGGLSEGVDYEGNLLRAVLVAGLPLSPPSVEVEALRGYLDQRLDSSKGYAYAYLYPAVNRVLQAAGRCIRDEGDRAVVLLLDGRFVQPRYRRYFPPDFPFRPVDDPVVAVRDFFGSATQTRIGTL